MTTQSPSLPTAVVAPSTPTAVVAPSTLRCYINKTNQVQIIRISNIPNRYFERVVFAGQRLVFEAPAEARLEIHTGDSMSMLISDRRQCSRLESSSDEVMVNAVR